MSGTEERIPEWDAEMELEYLYTEPVFPWSGTETLPPSPEELHANGQATGQQGASSNWNEDEDREMDEPELSELQRQLQTEPASSSLVQGELTKPVSSREETSDVPVEGHENTPTLGPPARNIFDDYFDEVGIDADGHLPDASASQHVEDAHLRVGEVASTFDNDDQQAETFTALLNRETFIDDLSIDSAGADSGIPVSGQDSLSAPLLDIYSRSALNDVSVDGLINTESGNIAVDSGRRGEGSGMSENTNTNTYTYTFPFPPTATYPFTVDYPLPRWYGLMTYWDAAASGVACLQNALQNSSLPVPAFTQDLLHNFDNPHNNETGLNSALFNETYASNESHFLTVPYFPDLVPELVWVDEIQSRTENRPELILGPTGELHSLNPAHPYLDPHTGLPLPPLPFYPWAPIETTMSSSPLPYVPLDPRAAEEVQERTQRLTNASQVRVSSDNDVEIDIFEDNNTSPMVRLEHSHTQNLSTEELASYDGDGGSGSDDQNENAAPARFDGNDDTDMEDAADETDSPLAAEVGTYLAEKEVDAYARDNAEVQRVLASPTRPTKRKLSFSAAGQISGVKRGTSSTGNILTPNADFENYLKTSVVASPRKHPLQADDVVSSASSSHSTVTTYSDETTDLVTGREPRGVLEEREIDFSRALLGPRPVFPPFAGESPILNPVQKHDQANTDSVEESLQIGRPLFLPPAELQAAREQLVPHPDHRPAPCSGPGNVPSAGAVTGADPVPTSGSVAGYPRVRMHWDNEILRQPYLDHLRERVDPEHVNPTWGDAYYDDPSNRLVPKYVQQRDTLPASAPARTETFDETDPAIQAGIARLDDIFDELEVQPGQIFGPWHGYNTRSHETNLHTVYNSSPIRKIAEGKAVHDAQVAARPFFRPGGVDRMINGRDSDEFNWPF